jgi:hypothetical protein
MNKLTSVLAAVLVIGSASVALADDPATDLTADALRNYGPVASQQVLTTRPVALPQHRNKVQVPNDSCWMDRASQTFGGGY